MAELNTKRIKIAEIKDINGKTFCWERPCYHVEENGSYWIENPENVLVELTKKYIRTMNGDIYLIDSKTYKMLTGSRK